MESRRRPRWWSSAASQTLIDETIAKSVAERSADLAYWRLAGGAEVDFIVGDMAVAIEAKATARITSDHLRHLRTLVEDHPHVGKRIVLCLEATPRRPDDGILVLPASEFTASLAAGEIF